MRPKRTLDAAEFVTDWAARLVVALALVAMSCTGASDQSTAESTGSRPPATASTTTRSAIDHVDYLDSIFNGELIDPADLYVEDPLYAEAGSPAAAYGSHRVNLRLVDRGSGDPHREHIVTPDGDTVSVCRGEATGDGCTIFAGFVTRRDGLVYTFTVDGVLIDDRLGDAFPSEKDSSAEVGTGIRTMSSYRSAETDNLSVVIELTAVLPSNVQLLDATYVDPTGRHVAPMDARGPERTPPG